MTSKLTSPAGIAARLPRWALAGCLAGAALTASAAIVTFDFESVPDDFHYFGGGVNLGGHYSGRIGGPVFGPTAYVLDNAAYPGSFDDTLYPPGSGTGVLFSEPTEYLDLTFTAGRASAVRFYYRSNSDLNLTLFDDQNNFVTVTGPASLGPDDPPGFLAFSAGIPVISHLRIEGGGAFFIVDDLSYDAIPEPAATVAIGALGLAGFALWRRRKH